MNKRSKDKLNRLWPAILALYTQIVTDPELDVTTHQAVYMVATAVHETAWTLKPVVEYKSDSRPYFPYVGRGYVQITHKYNYEKFSKILGVDLVNDPDLALKPDISYKILTYGMLNGTFTGKKLTSDMDYVTARKVVNGTDRAQDIADIATEIKQTIAGSNCYNDTILPV